MISSSDMITSMMGTTVAGVTGIQVDAMAVWGILLSIILILTGGGLIIEILQARKGAGAVIRGTDIPVPAGVYQGAYGSSGDEGSVRGHYSGGAPEGLIVSNRYRQGSGGSDEGCSVRPVGGREVYDVPSVGERAYGGYSYMSDYDPEHFEDVAEDEV